MASHSLILGQIFSVDNEMLDALPTYAKVIFAVLVAIAGLAITIKYSVEAIEKVRGNTHRKKTGIDGIKNHSFFSKCESWSKYKVNELYFGDDDRNKLFRAIVSSKIRVMSESALDALSNPEINDMNKQYFQTFIFKLLTDIQVKSQEEMLRKITEIYPENGSKIFELVVRHRDKGFNAFNQITDNYTERLVQIICESDLYSDNLEKYEMILDSFKSALGACFPHIEASFKGFNGDLDILVKNR